MNLLCTACSRALLPGTRLRALHPPPVSRCIPHARAEDCPAHAAHHSDGASPVPTCRKPRVATPSCTRDHPFRAYAPRAPSPDTPHHPAARSSFTTTVCAARTFATYPAHSPTPVATPTTAESTSRPARSDFAMDCGTARVLISGPRRRCARLRARGSYSFDGKAYMYHLPGTSILPPHGASLLSGPHAAQQTLDNLTTGKLPHTDRHHAPALPHLSLLSSSTTLLRMTSPGTGGVPRTNRYDPALIPCHDAVSITVACFDTLRHKRQIPRRIDVRASQLSGHDVHERVCERRKYGKLLLPALTSAARCMMGGWAYAHRRRSIRDDERMGWGRRPRWGWGACKAALSRTPRRLHVLLVSPPVFRLPRSPRTLSPVMRETGVRLIHDRPSHRRPRWASPGAQAAAHALPMDLGDITTIETLFPVRQRLIDTCLR
ncbi:hypothetical protein C8J57DRAFT_1503423 [Mycena rebaudengoi]|nr:hypothetical protein C8J57DRAFT_1503423 [Mycena rebaudengoi]